MLRAAVLHSLLRRIQRFSTSSRPEALVACYVAPWRLPRPDFHRLADDSFQDTPATCWAAFGDGKERCRPCLDDPFSFCGYSTGPNSFPWLCLEYLLIFAATQPGKTVCSGFVLNTCFRFAATPPSKIAFFGPVFILPFTDWLSTRPGKTDFV